MDKKQSLEVIDEVVEADRKIAREAIATGVRQAQDQWIESTLIAEELALEIIKVSRSSLSESAIAVHPRAIAISLESDKSLH